MTIETGTQSGGAARRQRALLLLCMAQFMLILDIAIVNVALPPIAEDLGFSPGNLQLVVTAYALTFGGLLLLGGRLSDLLGRRNAFVWGLGLFTLASLGCGLAPSAAFLVAARAMQGVGGALVAPAALSLLTSIFPEGEERNRRLLYRSPRASREVRPVRQPHDDTPNTAVKSHKKHGGIQDYGSRR